MVDTSQSSDLQSPFSLSKMSGIVQKKNICKKHDSILGGLTWLNFFMVCVKLVAMTIYKLNGLVGMI